MTHTPRFLYVCGTDGTGKTTQAQLLLQHQRAAGRAVEHRWVRFPFLVSVPLLAYARWRGWSWYEQTGMIRHGYWDFRRSLLLRALLPWSLLLDALIAAVPRIYLPILCGRTIVCERFVLDMLVDLGVALGEPALHRRLPGRLFPRLIPPRSGVAVMTLDAATIRARRADLQMDRRLEERLAMFARIADDLSLPVVESIGSMEDVNRQLEAIMQGPEQQPSGSGYAKLRTPGLRRLFGFPVVGVASHWAIQSMAYMDRTERAFKLSLDAIGTLVLGLLLGRFLRRSVAWFTAFMITHTLNFLLNGHLWGLLKHYNRVHSSHEDFMAYYEAFRARVKAEPSLRYAATYGSLARGDWKPSSDLDVRLVRHRGVRAAWRACWFTLNERTHALVHRFPLDIYVLDDWDALEAMSMEKTPTVLVERSGRST